MNETNCPKSRETLSAFFDGELPAAEREAFEKHLVDCAECREQLQWLEWTGEVIRALPEREPGTAFQARCREGFRRELGRQRSKSSSPWRQGVGWAAALAASVLLLLGLHHIMAPPSSEAQGPWVNESNTMVSHELVDGSWLEVSPGARVAWQLKPGLRTVVLYEGTINLEVEPDERPFIVRTPSGKVEVVGTRFRVKVFRAGDEIQSSEEQS